MCMEKKLTQIERDSRFIVGRQAILEARLDMNTQSVKSTNYEELGSVAKWMIPAEDMGHVKADMPLLHAYELMTKEQVGTLPVVENGRLQGIITLETVAQYVPQPNQAMLKTTLNDIMETDPFMLSPETAVQEAAKLMLSKEMDAVPIVDEKDMLLGIIRLEDILHIITRA